MHFFQLQFHEEFWVAETFLLEKIKDTMFIFLDHIIGLRFRETIKQ